MGSVMNRVVVNHDVAFLEPVWVVEHVLIFVQVLNPEVTKTEPFTPPLSPLQRRATA